MGLLLDQRFSAVGVRDEVPVIYSRVDLVDAISCLMGNPKGLHQNRFELDSMSAGAYDSIRLMAIASLLKSPNIQSMLDQIVISTIVPGAVRGACELDLRGTGNAEGMPQQSLETIAGRFLPGEWSLSLLWDDGVRFSENIEVMNLRLCAYVMGLFAARKTKVLSTIAFTIGFSLSYLWLGSFLS